MREKLMIILLWVLCLALLPDVVGVILPTNDTNKKTQMNTNKEKRTASGIESERKAGNDWR
jgi:hypothetical protein